MPKGIAFDLVLVLSLPLEEKEQPKYIAKDEVLTIGEMRKAVPHELNEAYNRAIDAIQR